MLFSESRCTVIAEIAQAHDGSLGTAHAYIDAVARAGADAVKFQTHIASAESTSAEPWRVRFSPQDATRYDYWRRMEFTEDQWKALKVHADERGLRFLSSPFSLKAAVLLHSIGVPAWKVASGEVNNCELWDYILKTNRPILMSTGMSLLREVDAAVARVTESGVPLVVMQCSSVYPCPPEKVGLNMLDVYRRRYGCPVGLSDHSGVIYSALAAAMLGISVVEVHVVFSRECFGPDVSSSLTTGELASLVEGIRFIERLRQNPIEKDDAACELEPIRAMFTKSLVVEVDLPAGAVLRREVLRAKKPGTGIPAERLPHVVGRTLLRPVTAGQMLTNSDIFEAVPAADA